MSISFSMETYMKWLASVEKSAYFKKIREEKMCVASLVSV
jgi:hypothetical protein